MQSGRRRFEGSGHLRACQRGGLDEFAAHVADRVEGRCGEAAERVVIELARLVAAIENLDTMMTEVVDDARVGAVRIAGPDTHRDPGFDECEKRRDRVGQQMHPGREALAGEIGAAHFGGEMLADRMGEAMPFEARLDVRVGIAGLAHDPASTRTRRSRRVRRRAARPGAGTPRRRYFTSSTSLGRQLLSKKGSSGL